MSSWQPIETAPKDGTEILVWDGNEHQILWWLDSVGWVGDDDFTDKLPTHWQPLPAPPDHSTSSPDTRIRGLQVDADGILWLILNAPSGKQAMVNLTRIGCQCAVMGQQIVADAINEIAAAHHNPSSTTTID